MSENQSKRNNNNSNNSNKTNNSNESSLLNLKKKDSKKKKQETTNHDEIPTLDINGSIETNDDEDDEEQDLDDNFDDNFDENLEQNPAKNLKDNKNISTVTSFTKKKMKEDFESFAKKLYNGDGRRPTTQLLKDGMMDQKTDISIDLSNKMLKYMPKAFFTVFTQRKFHETLKVINISHNSIRIIPCWFWKSLCSAKSLQKLDISHNLLQAVSNCSVNPFAPTFPVKLKQGNKDLTPTSSVIPGMTTNKDPLFELKDLPPLEELNLSHNHFEFFPLLVVKWFKSSLKVLNLSNNRLVNVCNEISIFQKIESMDFSHNPCIVSFPFASLFDLRTLKHVYMPEMCFAQAIKEIPQFLGSILNYNNDLQIHVRNEEHFAERIKNLKERSIRALKIARIKKNYEAAAQNSTGNAAKNDQPKSIPLNSNENNQNFIVLSSEEIDENSKNAENQKNSGSISNLLIEEEEYGFEESFELESSQKPKISTNYEQDSRTLNEKSEEIHKEHHNQTYFDNSPSDYYANSPAIDRSTTVPAVEFNSGELIPERPDPNVSGEKEQETQSNVEPRRKQNENQLNTENQENQANEQLYENIQLEDDNISESEYIKDWDDNISSDSFDSDEVLEEIEESGDLEDEENDMNANDEIMAKKDVDFALNDLTPPNSSSMNENNPNSKKEDENSMLLVPIPSPVSCCHLFVRSDVENEIIRFRKREIKLQQLFQMNGSSWSLEDKENVPFFSKKNKYKALTSPTMSSDGAESPKRPKQRYINGKKVAPIDEFFFNEDLLRNSQNSDDQNQTLTENMNLNEDIQQISAIYYNKESTNMSNSNSNSEISGIPRSLSSKKLDQSLPRNLSSRKLNNPENFYETYSYSESCQTFDENDDAQSDPGSPIGEIEEPKEEEDSNLSSTASQHQNPVFSSLISKKKRREALAQKIRQRNIRKLFLRMVIFKSFVESEQRYLKHLRNGVYWLSQALKEKESNKNPTNSNLQNLLIALKNIDTFNSVVFKFLVERVNLFALTTENSQPVFKTELFESIINSPQFYSGIKSFESFTEMKFGDIFAKVLPKMIDYYSSFFKCYFAAKSELHEYQNFHPYDYLKDVKLFFDLPNSNSAESSIFDQNLSKFSTFLSNSNSGPQVSSEILNNSSQFTEKLFKNPKGSIGMGLNMLCSLPLTRIQRYFWHFREIFKLTPKTHPDFSDLFGCVLALANQVIDLNNLEENLMNLPKMNEKTNQGRLIFAGKFVSRNEKETTSPFSLKKSLLFVEEDEKTKKPQIWCFFFENEVITFTLKPNSASNNSSSSNLLPKKNLNPSPHSIKRYPGNPFISMKIEKNSKIPENFQENKKTESIIINFMENSKPNPKFSSSNLKKNINFSLIFNVSFVLKKEDNEFNPNSPNQFFEVDRNDEESTKFKILEDLSIYYNTLQEIKLLQQQQQPILSQNKKSLNPGRSFSGTFLRSNDGGGDHSSTLTTRKSLNPNADFLENPKPRTISPKKKPARNNSGLLGFLFAYKKKK